MLVIILIGIGILYSNKSSIFKIFYQLFMWKIKNEDGKNII